MNRPYREIHELYKILFERAEAQQAAEKARQEKEAEEEKKRIEANRPKGIKSNQYVNDTLPDASTIQQPSPLELEALEEALEDMM